MTTSFGSDGIAIGIFKAPDRLDVDDSSRGPGGPDADAWI
jgi:hypothetical protein